MNEFKSEPCPPGKDAKEWSEHQNELRKEHERREALKETRNEQKERARTQTCIGVGVLIVASLAALVLIFVYRDAPEPISEDVRSLATALHVDLPKRAEGNWPSMDKETRALFRTLFLGAATAAFGFLFRGFFKGKEE